MTEDIRNAKIAAKVLPGTYSGWVCTQPGCASFYSKETGYLFWPKDAPPEHNSTFETEQAFCTVQRTHGYAIHRESEKTMFMCPVGGCKPIIINNP
jgi:hypothetical protein